LKAINESDIIMSFVNYGHQEEFEVTRRFWFDVSEVPLGDTILTTELRLYKEARPGGGRFKVAVYQLVAGTTGEEEMLDSVVVPRDQEGWIVLDVSAAMLFWQTFPKHNLGLLLKVVPEVNGEEEDQSARPRSRWRQDRCDATREFHGRLPEARPRPGGDPQPAQEKPKSCQEEQEEAKAVLLLGAGLWLRQCLQRLLRGAVPKERMSEADIVCELQGPRLAGLDHRSGRLRCLLLPRRVQFPLEHAHERYEPCNCADPRAPDDPLPGAQALLRPHQALRHLRPIL